MALPFFFALSLFTKVTSTIASWGTFKFFFHSFIQQDRILLSAKIAIPTNLYCCRQNWKAVYRTFTPHSSISVCFLIVVVVCLVYHGSERPHALLIQWQLIVFSSSLFLLFCNTHKNGEELGGVGNCCIVSTMNRRKTIWRCTMERIERSRVEWRRNVQKPKNQL